MGKFLILYNASEPAQEFMAKFSRDEMQAGMDEWMLWKDEAVKTVKFEFGLPLQSAGNISLGGVSKSESHITGHSFMEGDKEAVFESLKSHPHLKRPGANIDILEMISMPGL